MWFERRKNCHESISKQPDDDVSLRCIFVTFLPIGLTQNTNNFVVCCKIPLSMTTTPMWFPNSKSLKPGNPLLKDTKNFFKFSFQRENYRPPYSVRIYLFSWCDMSTSNGPTLLYYYWCTNVIGQHSTM